MESFSQGVVATASIIPSAGWTFGKLPGVHDALEMDSGIRHRNKLLIATGAPFNEGLPSSSGMTRFRCWVSFLHMIPHCLFLGIRRQKYPTYWTHFLNGIVRGGRAQPPDSQPELLLRALKAREFHHMHGTCHTANPVGATWHGFHR